MQKRFASKAFGVTEPLNRLLNQMAQHGASRFYAKRLAPNDNSKNQVYLGGGFGALNILPHGPIDQDESSRAGSVRDRAKALMRFFWIDEEGLFHAPDAQLILYPKYPEVRMSGFLQGADRKRRPSKLMMSRDEGRVLFFGVTPDGRVIGQVVPRDSPLTAALNEVADQLDVSGVFIELQALCRRATEPRFAAPATPSRSDKAGTPSKRMDPDGKPEPSSVPSDLPAKTSRIDHLGSIPSYNMVSDGKIGLYSARSSLLAELSRIHQAGWIASQKMGADGTPRPYSARNGGGYTLEAQLGISPNSYAEPDFLGWEVKQYGVRDFEKYSPKGPVTLMTPEPTGGVYRDEGVEAFLRSYGYEDKSGKANRINFGGVYSVARDFHGETGLRLALEGFDSATGKLTDVNGAILLVDRHDRIAASWGFKGIFEHWNRKHAKAVYVPSLMRSSPSEYKYGGKVHLCEGTDVLLLLNAVAKGAVYYDPGIKMEGTHTAKPTIKRRSQFRIKHQSLYDLYHKHDGITLRDTGARKSPRISQISTDLRPSDEAVQSTPDDRQMSLPFSNMD